MVEIGGPCKPVDSQCNRFKEVICVRSFIYISDVMISLSKHEHTFKKCNRSLKFILLRTLSSAINEMTLPQLLLLFIGVLIFSILYPLA